MKTDIQVQQDVLRELKWDNRVEDTEVGVEVESGVVTLTGTVTSYAKRMAAEDAAHRVAGVLDLANVRGLVNKLEVNLTHARTETIHDRSNRLSSGAMPRTL
jgi:osmotically-inducible protein OsmY